MPMNAIELAEDLQTRTGLPEQQARGIVRTILAAVEDATGTLVTRDHLDAELQKLRAELKTDIHELRAEVKSDIHQLRAELHQVTGSQLKWTMTTTLAVG